MRVYEPSTFALIQIRPHNACCLDSIEKLRDYVGLDVVTDAEDACRRFQLPRDRVGDIIVMGDQTTVLGTQACLETDPGLYSRFYVLLLVYSSTGIATGSLALRKEKHI